MLVVSSCGYRHLRKGWFCCESHALFREHLTSTTRYRWC